MSDEMDYGAVVEQAAGPALDRLEIKRLYNEAKAEADAARANFRKVSRDANHGYDAKVKELANNKQKELVNAYSAMSYNKGMLEKEGKYVEAKAEVAKYEKAVEGIKAKYDDPASGLLAEAAKERNGAIAEAREKLAAAERYEEDMLGAHDPKKAQAVKAKREKERIKQEQSLANAKAAASGLANRGDGDEEEDGGDDGGPDKQGQGKDGSNGAGLGASYTFLRDVGAALQGRTTGNTSDARAAGLNESARLSMKQAGQHEMNAQRHAQIANRNEFGEAGAIASAQNDAENRQTVQNAGAAAGNAAARLRKTNAPDVQAQQDRQDQQREKANQQFQYRDTMNKNAAQEQTLAAQYDVTSRNQDKSTDLAYYTTMAQAQQDQNQQDQNQGGGQGIGDGQKWKPPEQQQPNQQTQDSGDELNLQNGINASGADPNVGVSPVRRKRASDGSVTVSRWDANAGVATVESGNPDGIWTKADEDNLQVYIQANPDKFNKGNFNNLESERNDQSGGNIDQVGAAAFDNKTTVTDKNTDSDARIKNIEAVISDERCKFLKSLVDKGYDLPGNEVRWLAGRLGNKFSHGGKDYDTEGIGSWDGSILDAYADHIRNYLYTYKPEARNTDPDIDPDEQHIGPMAQDIEQVAPDCVKETEDGVKVVDGSRLALVNAGAIADLARDIKDIKQMLGGLNA